MVKVYQGGVEVKMSKRSGQAIGLLDLIEEVGVEPQFVISLRLVP
jgi:arginyl-tRNA synthetase